MAGIAVPLPQTINMPPGLCPGTWSTTSLTATPGPPPAWCQCRNARQRAASAGSVTPQGKFCPDICTNCGRELKVLHRANKVFHSAHAVIQSWDLHKVPLPEQDLPLPEQGLPLAENKDFLVSSTSFGCPGRSHPSDLA
eukprot:7086761-Heterocapsa_arctica.AAC.1